MPQETPIQTEVIISGEIETSYTDKLRLLSQIHCEIASELNTKREARLNRYHGEDDKYIPADPHEDLIALMQAVNACPS